MRLFSILLAVCTLFVFPNASAQNAGQDAFFRGTVVDAVTGEPIPFVTITPHRPDNSWPGASDFDGWFFIRCPKDWLFVEVRMKGYATEYMVVDLSSGWVEMQIMLIPHADGSQ